jgi:hypothetical protein
MTRQDLIISSTGCIRANADVARLIMTGQQTQHRVLAKSKNNPFRAGEIYWIREPGRVANGPNDGESLGEYLRIEYTADGCKKTVYPNFYFSENWERYEMGAPNWVIKRQGIPGGIFKEAARIFVKVNREWREPVQSASLSDMIANGAVANCKKCDLTSPYCKLCITFDFGSMLEKIKTNSWICNEDVCVCEFDLVDVTE